jgi:hypothetical protein
MAEKHLADRWQISLKTLQRWRLDNEGSVWYKLFRHVRYHEADILEFERRSAQHPMTLLGINREFKPAGQRRHKIRASTQRLKVTASRPRKSLRQHRCQSICSVLRPNAIVSACRT